MHNEYFYHNEPHNDAPIVFQCVYTHVLALSEGPTRRLQQASRRRLAVQNGPGRAAAACVRTAVRCSRTMANAPHSITRKHRRVQLWWRL